MKLFYFALGFFVFPIADSIFREAPTISLMSIAMILIFVWMAWEIKK